MYRVKHKASGLYYRPGSNNLTRFGKVYTTGNSCMSGNEPDITIRIKPSTKVFREFRHLIPGLKQDDFGLWKTKLPKSDFEIESV